MKATQIRATTFVALRDLELDLTRKVSVFVGRNGSGKSSVLDAVRAALVGTARGIPRGEVSSLATWGSKTWSVEVDFLHGDAEGTLRRTPTKLYGVDEEGTKHVLSQEQIAAVLGSPKTLSAVFDVWRALEMTPAERKELVFALAGIDLDATWLRENGIEDDEVLDAIVRKGWKKAESIAA
jgi:recombinational DNA repair ATPase RecF